MVQCKWVSAELDFTGLASARESALGIVVVGSGHRSDKIFPYRSEVRGKGPGVADGGAARGQGHRRPGQQGVRVPGTWAARG